MQTNPYLTLVYYIDCVPGNKWHRDLFQILCIFWKFQICINLSTSRLVIKVWANRWGKLKNVTALNTHTQYGVVYCNALLVLCNSCNTCVYSDLVCELFRCSNGRHFILSCRLGQLIFIKTASLQHKLGPCMGFKCCQNAQFICLLVWCNGWGRQGAGTGQNVHIDSNDIMCY